MAQEQSIEAARSRIQRLVEEIAALSRKETRSEEYFQEFLARVVQATDGRGGAVWLVSQRAQDGKSEFQLVAHVELESSLFHADEQQHAYLTRQLGETVQTKRASVAGPQSVGPDPGSLEAQIATMQGQAATPALTGNRTPYPFFHIPLMLKEQVIGVLQVWLQPYVVQANYQEFVAFLTSLGSHVEQHMHQRRLGNLVMENQRLQQVLKFSSDVAGSLDPLEVARLASNYGRDLLSCERCSVLKRNGDRWEVLSISGQEMVEKKSSMVKAMAAFVGAHAQLGAFKKQEQDPKTGALTIRHEILILSKKDLLALAETASKSTDTGKHLAVATAGTEGTPHPYHHTEEIDLNYFEHSHVVSAAIAPMFDTQGDLVGAFFAESTTEGFFVVPTSGKEASGTQRLAEWLAVHTGKALVAAEDYRTIPFRGALTPIRTFRRSLTGDRRKRTMLRLAILGVLLTLTALYPKADQVDGNCVVNPSSRAAVVPEVPGRLEKIFVREGSPVKKGDQIAQLDTSRLELERDSARQEALRMRAEADRLRGLGDEAQAQTVLMQGVISEKRVESLTKDIEAATLRSPIDGVVLTKDLELHVGEPLQPGTNFAEVASMERWELLVEVNEKKIGKIESTLSAKGKLPIDYILYSQSAEKLQGFLEKPQQISAMAYPREKENVFIVTLYDLQVPPALKSDLRPGLTGRAKVGLGYEPLAWWTVKSIVDWFRMKLLH